MELTSLLTAGPMAVVVWVLFGVIGVVALFRLFLKKPMQLRRHDAEERVLKQKVAEKAARRNKESTFDEDENLTDSGIFSVLEMMDALASGGNFEEAEKWALNAIHNQPDRTDVPIKLAEIYYKTGRKIAFLAVVNNLIQKGLDVPVKAWDELARMGVELAPEEAAFAAIRERVAGSSATLH